MGSNQPFVEYRHYGQLVDITKNLIHDDTMLPAQNPWEFISEFDVWFKWEKAVRFDKADPIELNIEILKDSLD